MKIIEVTEGAEVVNATSTSLINETVLSPKRLPEEVVELPRAWPHDMVLSWSY